MMEEEAVWKVISMEEWKDIQKKLEELEQIKRNRICNCIRCRDKRGQFVCDWERNFYKEIDEESQKNL